MRHPWPEWLLLIALVITYFSWLTWPLIWTASADQRLVFVFNADEASNLAIVQDAIRRQSLDLHESDYGQLYYNIALLPLLLARAFGPISEQAIIVTLRLVSAVSGAATVVATFALARYCFGRLSAWLSALLLAIVPLAFLQFSVISHPDVPQLIFLVLAVYFCCRLSVEGRWRWLILTSVFAGFAFATKYAGAFLLPIMGIVGLAQIAGGGLALGGRPKWVALLAMLGLAAASFGAAFALTSPFSIVGLKMLYGLSWQAWEKNFGYLFKDRESGLNWLQMLVSTPLLNKPVSALGVASLMVTALSLRRRGLKQAFGPMAVLWLWIAAYLGFVVLRIGWRAAYYLLPIVPFFIILATHPISLLIRSARSRMPSLPATALAGAILVIVCGLVLPEPIASLLSFRQQMLDREETSDAVKAGLWLTQHYPNSTRVLYDSYTYLPSSFAEGQSTWAGTLDQLAADNPEVVMVYEGIANRFSDPTRAADYYEGEASFRRSYKYYRAFREGTTKYSLAADFGSVHVYARPRQLVNVPFDSAEWLRPSSAVRADLGPYLTVVGYSLDRHVTPGGTMHIVLHTLAGQPFDTPGDWRLRAHLIDRHGKSWAWDQTERMGINDSWRVGDAYIARLDIATPGALSPGLYDLRVDLVDERSKRQQRVVDGAGRDIGTNFVLTTVRAVDAAAAPPPATHPLSARFGQQIKLLGYDLDVANISDGLVRMTPHFQPVGPTNEDYTVFVHLVDREGRLVAQHDGQPQGGSAPTSLWQQGEVIADAHLVHVERSLAGQQLGIVLGMYNLQTGRRLAVFETDGGEVGNSLRVGTVNVP